MAGLATPTAATLVAAIILLLPPAASVYACSGDFPDPLEDSDAVIEPAYRRALRRLARLGPPRLSAAGARDVKRNGAALVGMGVLLIAAGARLATRRPGRSPDRIGC